MEGIHKGDLFNRVPEKCETQCDALFSNDGIHRIWLFRKWRDYRPIALFIGLNPSTANADTDDATIRRIRSICNSLGYGGFYMMNLFTFISTDPKQLNMTDGNIIDANEYLITIASCCDDIFFAWGNFKVLGRDKEVEVLFNNAKCLFKNKNGSPKHPLYCRSDIKPVSY